MPELLEQFGVDPDSLLRECGLSVDMLQSPTATAHASCVNQLLNLCAQRTGCAHFALLIGQKYTLAALGDVGRLVTCSPDVGTALRNLVTRFKFHNGAALVWLQHDEGTAALHYCIYEAREDSCTQLYAGAAVCMVNVLAELCGAGWSAIKVELPFRRPADSHPYRTLLRAPLLFDANSVSVRFDSRWLDHPVRTADAAEYAALEGRFRQMEALGDSDFPSIVRRLILRQLLIDKCDAASIAGALAMHRRSLDRHLDAADTTFRDLQDGVKCDIARRLLRETSLTVQQISVHLRYSSVGNFSTAFRRWSGQTPRTFRARSTQPPGAMVPAARAMPMQRKASPDLAR